MYVCTYVHTHTYRIFVATHIRMYPVCPRTHPLSSAHSLVIPSFLSCICHVSIHTCFLAAHPFVYLPSLFPSLSLHNLSLTTSPVIQTFSPFIHSSAQPPVTLQSYSHLFMYDTCEAITANCRDVSL
jgi:hypothetical protein